MTETPPPGTSGTPGTPAEPDPVPGPPTGGGRWPGWPSKSAGRPAVRRTGLRRLLPTWRMLLAASLVAVTASFVALLAGYLLVDIPEPKAAAVAQNNVYLYADGSQLARVGEVNREIIDLDQVPAAVRHAVLAAEDRDFYSSSAVDIAAMVRAGWNMLHGEGRQSGSTITQQYVKNYYLDQEQTLTRKLNELFIAVKLGREVSKDEILAGYLNTSYFGRNAYGIQAAAQAYYGKDTHQLTVAEGAYLAALLAAPSAYDVRANPDERGAAMSRWNYVLDGMVTEGWLAEERRDTMRFPEPLPVRPANDLSGQTGYLVEAAQDYLLEAGVVDEAALAEGGLKITTTFDPDRQQALSDAMREQLMSALDPELRPEDVYARAGAASVEVGTGRVVALYGGRDFTEMFLNNATRRDYQAASTFKPFVYAAALEHAARTGDGELIGPDTKYNGDSGREVVGTDGEGTGWSPENEGEKDYGEVTVAEAMDLSINAVFAQVGADVGTERVREVAVALGIPADTPGLDGAHGSIALGTATPSPLDLAQAYATLADHGVRHPAVLVERITRDGEKLPLPSDDTERVLSREAADATTAVLRGVVDQGTGMAALSAGRPAAGKTGTAEEDRAAWFAGYTPELSTVVAVFGQDPVTGVHRPLYGVAGLERINGGGFPAMVWGQYTADAMAGAPPTEFVLTEPEPDISPEPPEPSGEPTTPASPPPASPAPTTPSPTAPEPTAPQPTDEAPSPAAAGIPAPSTPAASATGSASPTGSAGPAEPRLPERAPGRPPESAGGGGATGLPSPPYTAEPFPLNAIIEDANAPSRPSG
ncbi:transglycosylase domain-containing protein [Streptomyces sp. B6B3]|uniref:transglycosylase domain-containing protein n=1 Tax=Streptomyces sp. B6B3 TaxID=3153570 RepID=UPI00325F2BBB